MKFQFKKIKSNTLAGVFLHLVLAVGLFLLLAIFYFYVYLPNSTNHGETITVPDIEGKTIDQLEAELEKKSLRFEVSDSTYSEDFAPLTVIKQYPHPGAKVKEGRKIFISINRINPPSVPVPNLIDGSVVNADAVLRSNQLKRGRIELIPGQFNVVHEMRYKGQKIEPLTRVPKGSVIDLVVMDGGGGNEEVPDFTNYTFEDAKFHILGYNLSIGSVYIVGGDTLQRNPVVLKQMPAPGENIKVGESVDLWIGPAGTIVHDDDTEQ
jgi:eukaryotic-like serine/threonine-protein kinase